MKKTIKINKGNWSGEETKLTYDETTKKFTLACMKGYKFWLEPEPEMSGLLVYHIKGADWDPDHSLGTLWKWDDDKEWSARTLGISREDENMFVAAAQLLCMTV